MQQITQLYFRLRFLNAGNPINNGSDSDNRVMVGYPITLKVQDFNFEFKPDFYEDSAFDKSVSGKLRSNIRGTRLSGSFNWNTSTEPSKIRALVKLLGISYKRTIYSGTNTTTATTTSIQLGSGFPAITDYFNGQLVTIGATSPVLVTDYTSAGVVTLAESRTVANTDTALFQLFENQRVELQFSINATDYYSIILSDYSLNLLYNFTIGTEPIFMQYQSIERLTEIPSEFEV